jgi:hypothetical protein
MGESWFASREFTPHAFETTKIETTESRGEKMPRLSFCAAFSFSSGQAKISG